VGGTYVVAVLLACDRRGGTQGVEGEAYEECAPHDGLERSDAAREMEMSVAGS
jgi:hypothetical protein